jgi:hypothetical protein
MVGALMLKASVDVSSTAPSGGVNKCRESGGDKWWLSEQVQREWKRQVSGGWVNKCRESGRDKWWLGEQVQREWKRQVSGGWGEQVVVE